MSIKNIIKQSAVLAVELECYLIELDQTQAKAKLKALRAGKELNEEKTEQHRLLIKEYVEATKLSNRLKALDSGLL